MDRKSIFILDLLSECNVYKFTTKGKCMSFKARNDPEGLPPEDSKGGWVLSDVIYILTNCELITRNPAIALFPVGLRKFLV